MSGFALGVSGFALGVSGFALGVSGFALGVSGFALGVSGFALGASAFALGVSAFALGASRFALGASRFSFGASRFLFGASRFSLGASRFALGASRFALGVSRFLFGASRFSPVPTRFTARASRFSPRHVPLPSPACRFSANSSAMTYSMRDLVARSGLSARTLRKYRELGLLPRLNGHGLGAEYDEAYVARAVALGRLRAKGMALGEVQSHVEGWTDAKYRRFVAETEPSPDAGAAPPEHDAPARELEGAPIADARPRALAEPADAELPDAPAWRIYSLLTGVGLMVDVDAPPIAHRIAREILANYGQRRTRG